MRGVLFAVLLALAVPAAHAADVQFHILTEDGNTFIISPPDLPRPPNIIGETAHLVVSNPPNGMFVLTAANGTTHKFTPLQSGLDTDGFGGGTVRVVLDSDWGSADDYTFRDQPFGTISASGQTMYHPRAMPLATGLSPSYHNVTLVDDSRFGLDPPTGHGNSLGLSVGVDGEYQVEMGSRNRAGLDFGPGTGSGDQTYYIFRGCATCDAEVVVGYGNPTHDRSTLPNDPLVVDHERGWESAGGCGASDSSSWSGIASRMVSGTYDLPAPAHSQAGDYEIANRYDDLSVLPRSHSSCSGTPYTDGTADNRKHDMCITGESASANTTYSYPCTRTITTETYLNGALVSTTTTTGSCAAKTLTSAGSCNTPHTTQTGNGYRVSASCSGGSAPSTPSPSTTTTSTGNLSAGTITQTVTTYSSWSSRTTSASVSSSCSLVTNTPHLNLADAMTVQPGLNVYRPTLVPTTHNIFMVLDDTENGGGAREYIQVLRHDGPPEDPAGPFDFHLRPSTSGILYDAHQHYGWVDTITYNTGQLSEMGYTPHAVMASQNDGLLPDGTDPYLWGQRLCHGDCFMGREGINTVKPTIKEVAPTASHPVSSHTSGLIYDHENDRWFDSAFTGSANQVVASTLYLLVPFAEDVSMVHVNMYNEHFDPANQNPSIRDAPGTTLPCHLNQSGQAYQFAPSMNVNQGDALKVPILPETRYLAFIGNDLCYWYDIAALPSPLASVASGARTVPLVNGTVLTGDLTVNRGGSAHVDVVADLSAVWQSEMYGLAEPGTAGNVTWVVPPLEVEVVAVARVNGAGGACGDPRVYCSDPVTLSGGAAEHGAYIHSSFTHGEPYVEAPAMLPHGSGVGVYGMVDGRCYGLASVVAETGGIIVRDIPRITVSTGDTITLSFNATVVEPTVVRGNVAAAMPASSVCVMDGSVQTAVLEITTMTATLR